MVVFNKTKMFDDITEAFPPGEFPGFDDQSAESAFVFDERIDLTGNCNEVVPA
jgi:hypothetical protein